jgi:hypothetical protein
MQANKFTTTWINLRESYDMLSRSNLLQNLYKNNKMNLKKVIDLGGGNGSFLRWCHYKNIIYDDFLIVDNDEALLKSFYPRTKSYLSTMSLSLVKDNMMSYRIQRLKKNKDGFITLKKQDLYKSIDIINDYNLVSFSAVSDLLSKKFIKCLFDKIDKGTNLYFSICFDGRVKWKNKNKHDKYIVSMFNQHQKQEKTTGVALGLNSINFIKSLSKKNDYKIYIADSSWSVDSYDNDSRIFQKAYLNTIYKPLKKFELIDQDILEDWLRSKQIDIESKNSNLVVGHKDILIET